MRKIYLLFMFSLFGYDAFSQTTIISSAVSTNPNGSFENATSTFAANGWTVVNNATNQWFVGTTVANAGTKGAYIGTASGNNNYTNTTSQVSHFYRDVTFPAGETCISLSFNWKGDGESCCDYLKVYLTSTATAVTAGTQQAAGDLIGGAYNTQTTWQTANITIPAANAGTTKRLVFSWRNDGSVGTNPAIAVDNISLTSAPGFTPTYATVPYTQDFEAWSSSCGTSLDLPSTNWLNTPSSGNNSWRRDDQGVSNGGWGSSSGAYSPLFTTTAHSARIHTYSTSSTNNLDLYVNLSGIAGTKTFSFDYINTSGSDGVNVLLSTDGGATFPTTLFTLTTTSGWVSQQSCSITSNSTTAVIRFATTGDAGSTDIGIDNLAIIAPCSGTPTGGTASASSTSLCAPASVNFSVTGGSTSCGLTYQWQSSPDNATWSDIAGATSSTYSATVSATTYFRRVTTCTSSGLNGNSASVQVTVTPIVYATLPYTQDFESWVNVCNTKDVPSTSWRNTPATGAISWRRDDEGVTAGGWGSLSGAYSPLFTTTAHSARIHTYASSSTNNFDLYVDLSGISGIKTFTFDYTNTDGSDGVNVLLSTDGGATFPTTLFTLTTTSGWVSQQSCDITSNSTTAVIRFATTGDAGLTDIGIDNLAIVAPCSGTPTGGNAAATSTAICVPTSITFSVTGASTSCGLTYQWQSSTDNVTFSDISGATSTTYTATISSSGYYRRITTCSSSGNSANSASVAITYSAPTYATLPYSQGFESWINGCNTTDIPSNNWRNSPFTGNNSWRRDDQGASAAWSSNSGIYAPVFSAGAHSARFHTYDASSGNKGTLLLYVDLSSTATAKTMTFDYINTSGSDALDIYLSTDGGNTFGASLLSLGTAAAWTGKTLCLNSNSATCVVKIEATSDYGSTDIGMDNLLISATCSGAPTAGNAAASVTSLCQAGGSTNLSLTGASTNCALTYQWQSSPDNATWTNIAGATSSTYTATVSASTYYRCVVCCGGSCNNSASVQVTISGSCDASIGTGLVTVASLPFTSGASTTCGAVDNLTSSNTKVCGSSSYYTGEDKVYKFTPAASGEVTINLTSSGSYTGLMLYDGCPLNCYGAANCIAYSQSSTGNKSICATVSSGTTYYLIVDSYAAPSCNAYSDLTISAPNTSVVNCNLDYTVSTTAYSLETGLTSSLNMSDDILHSAKTALGFTFCFDGRQYTDMYIASNSSLVFDAVCGFPNLQSSTTAAASASTGYTISSGAPVNGTSIPRNAILGPWHDIHPTTSSTTDDIRYQTLGASPNRRFVITFGNIPMYDCESNTTLNFTGQIKLYETSNIVEVHLNKKEICTSWNNAQAVLGLHNYNGTRAVIPTGYNATSSSPYNQWTATNLAWRFTPNGVCATCTPLPIGLVEFTGTKKANGNLIKWITESETNNELFVLEWSRDGMNFEEIYRVKGAGNSNVILNYSFLDTKPANGKNYYRMYQKDFDGKISVSNVVLLDNSKYENIFDISLFPNPAASETNLQFKSQVESNARIALFDISGKHIKSADHKILAGQNDITIDLKGISKGVYFVRVSLESSGETFNSKLVVN